MKDILDLTRFPLDQPGSSGWTDLVARCRADLAAEGMFNLDGLMLPVVAAGVADALADCAGAGAADCGTCADCLAGARPRGDCCGVWRLCPGVDVPPSVVACAVATAPRTGA